MTPAFPVVSGNEFQTSAAGLAPNELELTTMLVQAIGAPFAPEEFKDAYREGVERLIARKLERKEVAASAPAQEPAAAPVVNIIDVLRKSLELAKKAVRTEVEVARRKPERATEAKSSEGKSKAQRRKA